MHAERMITNNQRKKLFAVLREAGITNRADRITLAQSILDVSPEQLDSFTQLTEQDAEDMIFGLSVWKQVQEMRAIIGVQLSESISTVRRQYNYENDSDDQSDGDADDAQEPQDAPDADDTDEGPQDDSEAAEDPLEPPREADEAPSEPVRAPRSARERDKMTQKASNVVKSKAGRTTSSRSSRNLLADEDLGFD